MAPKAIAYVLIALFVLLVGCGTTTSPATTAPAVTAQPSEDSPSGTAIAATNQPAAALQCPDASGPIKGSIVFVGDGNLLAVNQDGGNLQQFMTLPTAQWSQNPAWSPDAQTLAYTLNVQHPDAALSWLPMSIICGLERATGKGRLLAQAQKHESLSEPTWTSDGKGLYISRARHQLDANNQFLGTQTEVARYDFASNTATTIVKDSSGPALSRDGKHLAYVFNNPETFELQLMLADAAGQNSQAINGPGTGFGSILGASWSSDGTKLIFAASGGNAAQQRTQPRAQSVLDRVLGIEVATAHGAPMDVWTVDADGRNLQQLTAKSYDDPRATWSPDQQHIAILTNGGGVILVNVADGTEQQLTDRGNFGGITWAAQ